MKNTQKHIASVVILIFAFFAFSQHNALCGNDGMRFRTICIDPGHGGKDPGCLSPDGKTFESKVNLDIALRLQRLIKENCPGIKVVMTRTTDVFVTLEKRAEIANRNNADLFFSIHADSNASKATNGFAVFVLGESSNKNRDLYAYNMEVCKRENSVIMLEDDYTTTYQNFNPSDPESFIFFKLMQNVNFEQSFRFAEKVEANLRKGPMRASKGIRQGAFYLLWKTSMPAALLEAGFMSNATDLATLKSAEGCEKIAKGVLKALQEYIRAYDQTALQSGSATGNDIVAESRDAAPASKPAVSGKKYGIQILAGGKRLKENDPVFRGNKPTIIWNGRIYKYIICVSDSLDEVKKNLRDARSKFAGSFVVEIKDDDAGPVK
ncbi:MAG: N-acetylmuramoyl-L-alanine amidase [Candidatus Cryptobacteroides sp.]